MVEALYGRLPLPWLFEVPQRTAVFAPDGLGPEHARRWLLQDVLLQGEDLGLGHQRQQKMATVTQ